MPQTALLHLRKLLLPLLAAVILMTGCGGTPPVSYYRLSAAHSDRGETSGQEFGDKIIGLGPLRLPEHLDRPQMVILLDGNRVQLSESHRWVEPLAENLLRVLRENLAALLDTERLLLYPWRSTAAVDYQLIIDVERFAGAGFRAAQLEAVWSVLDGEGKVLLPPQRSVYQTGTETPDHPGLVGAQSEALALFSSDLAQQFLLLAKESSRKTP